MTITLRLPGTLEAALKARVEADSIALSDFVRAAIEEKLERRPETKPSAFEAGKPPFGKYGSGRSDLAIDHKKILREKLRAKHRS